MVGHRSEPVDLLFTACIMAAFRLRGRQTAQNETSFCSLRNIGAVDYVSLVQRLMLDFTSTLNIDILL